MIHPKLPIQAATTECPMRAWRDPRAQQGLIFYRRVKRWGALACGQPSPYDLDLLDAVEDVMDQPMPKERGPENGSR